MASLVTILVGLCVISNSVYSQAVGIEEEYVSNAIDAVSPIIIQCPKEFLRLGYACYFFSKKMMPWEEAYFDCLNRNSTLFNVDSDYEDRTIRKYLNKRQLVRLNRWIGGFYNWFTERWIWGSTGQEMDFSGFSTGTKDSPLGSTWQCTYMSPSLFYRWNYAPCLARMHYICKAPQTTGNT